MATCKEIALHLDLSQSRVNQLLKEGILSKARGQDAFDFDNCRVQYIRYMRDSAFGEQNNASLNDVKIKLVQAQGEKAELEAKLLKGRLVPTEEVQDYWIDFVSNCKAKLLALPGKLAHRIQGAEDHNEIEEILTADVHEALMELSQDGIPIAYKERTKKDT